MIYVALLRGINVGGHNKVKMADLKRLFETIGLGKVQTYIQSGNVLFESEEGAQVTGKRYNINLLLHENKSFYIAMSLF